MMIYAAMLSLWLVGDCADLTGRLGQPDENPRVEIPGVARSESFEVVRTGGELYFVRFEDRRARVIRVSDGEVFERPLPFGPDERLIRSLMIQTPEGGISLGVVVRTPEESLVLRARSIEPSPTQLPAWPLAPSISEAEVESMARLKADAPSQFIFFRDETMMIWTPYNSQELMPVDRPVEVTPAEGFSVGARVEVNVDTNEITAVIEGETYRVEIDPSQLELRMTNPLKPGALFDVGDGRLRSIYLDGDRLAMLDIMSGQVVSHVVSGRRLSEVRVLVTQDSAEKRALGVAKVEGSPEVFEVFDPLTLSLLGSFVWPSEAAPGLKDLRLVRTSEGGAALIFVGVSRGKTLIMKFEPSVSLGRALPPSLELASLTPNQRAFFFQHEGREFAVIARNLGTRIDQLSELVWVDLESLKVVRQDKFEGMLLLEQVMFEDGVWLLPLQKRDLSHVFILLRE